MTTHRLKMPFKPLLMIILVLFALTVQGCFHRSDNDSDDGPTNAAPVFTSGTAISVGDGSTATGYTATATDADGDTVTFSLSGGTDQNAFSIDGDSGELSFNSAPDFDAPSDSDVNNAYEIEITATDGTIAVVQNVTVTVIDDANPMGYYTNTGTASVSDDASGTMVISDLQAMVNGSRIMMMSVANQLLYDGTITSISGNKFTADFTIYRQDDLGNDGWPLPPVSATASGIITAGSSITGTLTGSGVGSGTFSLIYALSNDQTAAIPRIENGLGNIAWAALIGTAGSEQEFVIDQMGVIAHDLSSAPGIFSSCDFNGSITPVIGSSLYEVAVTLTNCNAGGGLANGTYTGLATSRSDSTQDDTLVFAVTNGTYSPNADFI